MYQGRQGAERQALIGLSRPLGTAVDRSRAIFPGPAGLLPDSLLFLADDVRRSPKAAPPQFSASFLDPRAGRHGSTSLARQNRSEIKRLRRCSAPLRPWRVTSDRAGQVSLRRAALSHCSG